MTMTMTTESAARAVRHTTGSRCLRVVAATLAAGLLALQAGCGDDTSEPSACVDDAARTVSCGAGGEQAQVCAGGVWVDDGACVEPEPGDCADGAERTVECGVGGEQAQVCAEGVWIDDGACFEPECALGEQQAVACAEDAERLQLQACADGVWVDDGACFEPECDEGEVLELDCGPVTEGAASPACVLGRWENGAACVCPEGRVYDDVPQSCVREVATCEVDGAPFGGGDGTAEAPFLICSVAQLHAVRARDGVESHYVLAATLDLSDEEGFAPLGTLHGSFDGAGHALTGLTLEATPEAGLFASVGAVGDEDAAPGVVRDLVLRGFDVQGGTRAGALAPVVGASSDNVVERVRLYASEVATSTASEVAATGGLVGHLMAGTLRDGVVDATISGHVNTGGVVGLTGVDTLVVGCDVAAEVVGGARTGGVVGQAFGPVEDCHARVTVTGGNNTGGVVGWAHAPIVRLTASGAVSGGQNAGGVAGRVEDRVSDCHADVDVSANNNNAGGLVGLAHALVENSSAAGVVGGNVDHTGGLIGRVVGETGGEVVDCSASGAVTGVQDYVGGLVGRAAGPVAGSRASGAVAGRRAVGGLVGRVEGASVEGSEATGDVFATSTFAGGLVGLALGPVTGSSAHGDVAGGASVGGLVGRAEGIVTESHASGDVQASANVGGLVGVAESRVSGSRAYGGVTGEAYVGGLVGFGYRDVEACAAYGDVFGGSFAGGLVGSLSGNAVDSAAHGHVEGSFSVGGLVGRLVSGGSVTRCQAWGDVVGTLLAVGGLVGDATGPVASSFARGSVSAGDIAGGLVGLLNGVSVVDSWCDGSVSSAGRAGGLVGATTPETAIRRSWTASSVSGEDDDAAGLLCGRSSDETVFEGVVAVDQSPGRLVGGDPEGPQPDLSDTLAVTDDELALPSTFTALGWDFEEVWVISTEGGVTAPDLRENPRGE